MKIIIYYILLLVFISLLSGFLYQQNQDAMSMKEMVSVSLLLVIYVVVISVVGEGRSEDERETHHRYLANRIALLAGTIVLSVGILYQLFFSHRLDYWLLAGLISINIVKILSFIYSHHHK